MGTAGLFAGLGAIGVGASGTFGFVLGAGEELSGFFIILFCVDGCCLGFTSFFLLIVFGAEPPFWVLVMFLGQGLALIQLYLDHVFPLLWSFCLL